MRKESVGQIIPRNIVQTWKDAHMTGLSEQVKDNVNRWKQMNPNYNYTLYGNLECAEYLETHFSQKYVDTFKCIVPGAYKADFFRYAVLYNEGGVYMDIDSAPVDGMDLDTIISRASEPSEKPLDFLSAHCDYNVPGVSIEFMACVPGLECFKDAMDAIVHNVEEQWYPDLKNHLPEYLSHINAKPRSKFLRSRWASRMKYFAITGPTLFAACLSRRARVTIDKLPSMWDFDIEGKRYRLMTHRAVDSDGNRTWRDVVLNHKNDNVTNAKQKYNEVMFHAKVEDTVPQKEQQYMTIVDRKQVYCTNNIQNVKSVATEPKKDSVDSLTSQLKVSIETLQKQATEMEESINKKKKELAIVKRKLKKLKKLVVTCPVEFKSKLSKQALGQVRAFYTQHGISSDCIKQEDHTEFVYCSLKTKHGVKALGVAFIDLQPPDNTYWIKHLLVNDEVRRTGVATRMLHEIVRKYPDKNFGITTKTVTDNGREDLNLFLPTVSFIRQDDGLRWLRKAADADDTGAPAAQKDSVDSLTRQLNNLDLSNPTEQCLKKNYVSRSVVTTDLTSREQFEFPDLPTDTEDWLQLHESRIVCILSVSLYNPNSDDKPFQRKKFLTKALEAWTSHGWYPLIFVPLRSKEQYINCAHLESETVRIVGYDIEPQTCGRGMVVGESRNAILHFVQKFKHIFKTCAVADERVCAAHYGINAATKVNKKVKDQSIVLKNKYGFEVIKLVKDFLADGGNGDSFMALEEDFNEEFNKLFDDKVTKRIHSFDSTIYSKKSQTSHSLWYDLAARSANKNQITMVGFGTRMRNNRWIINRGKEAIRQRPSGNRDSKYYDYHEAISGFIIFKVGGEEGWANSTGKGWHGQQYYTKTTMCEDNVWSYNWTCNPTLGDVGEVRCVTTKGQGDKTDSITRKKNVDLSDNNKYSDCALREILKALSSESYKIEDGHVVMRWTKPCGNHIKLDTQKKKPNTPYDYREQAEYLVGLSDECEHRGIRGRGDDEEPELMQKVKDICDILKAGGITTRSSSTPRIEPKLRRMSKAITKPIQEGKRPTRKRTKKVPLNIGAFS